MRTLKTVTVALTLVCGMAHRQVGRRLQEAAGRAAEREATRQTEQRTERAVDSAFDGGVQQLFAR